MYHVSTQGIDERMINVHYYYLKQGPKYAMLGSFQRHDAEPIWVFFECTDNNNNHQSIYSNSYSAKSCWRAYSKHTHAHTDTHKHTDNTQLNLQTTNRDLKGRKIAQRRKYGMSIVLRRKKILEV